MDRTLNELRAVVTHADVSAPAVSAWSVGMHIHHVCLSMIGISKLLQKSKTPAPPVTPRSRVLRTVAFTLGRFPRGRVKSPAVVVPQPAIPQAELLTLLDEAEKAMAAVVALDRGVWFKHPVFGALDRGRAITFNRIHNRHHLRIVSDILKAGRSAGGDEGATMR